MIGRERADGNQRIAQHKPAEEAGSVAGSVIEAANRGAISSMEQPPATITTMLSGVSTSMNRARFKVLTSVPSNTSMRYSPA